jgi:peptide deformylase
MRRILPQEENPVLRDIAKEIPLESISGDYIQTLIKDMKELLSHEEYGVALAAPQLGESVRLFIVSGRALARDKRIAPDEGEDEAPEPPALPDQVYINPVLEKLSRGRKKKHEGCLSIRGKWGVVPRAEKGTVSAYDERGKKFTRGASGFLAHVFQHEMDHLEGILYIDKAVELYDDEKKADE